MKKRTLAGLICCAYLSAANATDSMAADDEITAAVDKLSNEHTEYVATGVIASRVQSDSRSIEAETSGGSAPGDRKPVISGSIRRSQGGKCVASITNTGKLDYAISFIMLGTDADGREHFKRYYYADLEPKQSVQRSLRCAADLNLSLVLNTAQATQ